MGVKKILIISGPTGMGKTKLSLDIASTHTQFEIINFDSLLFYKELNIGTAKPTTDELTHTPHHMVNIASIAHPLNAADYCKKTIPIIHKLHQENKIPILVGGSGFYLRALIQGMYPTHTPSSGTLKKSNQLYEEKGIQPFWQLLLEVDPISAQKLHMNDHYRVRRAIEFYWTSGYPISQAPKKQKEQPAFYQTQNWNLKHIYLNIPKEDHYPLINQRAKKMIEQGLIDEVAELLKHGFSGNEKPLQSIGYKETLKWLNQEVTSKTQLQELIFIATRRLAKSQRTWFQSINDKTEFNPLINYQDALEFALNESMS